MRRLIFKILIIVLRLCQMLKGNWVWSIQDPLDYFCKSSVHSCMLRRFSRVQLFATLWTIALQAPLSMEFSRQEYCSGLPCPPPGDLPNPGIELASLPSPALAGRFFTASATWEVHSSVSITSFKKMLLWLKMTECYWKCRSAFWEAREQNYIALMRKKITSFMEKLPRNLNEY